MNQEHHNINTGSSQPPANSETSNPRITSASQPQSNNITPTTSATDLRVNSAAVNVALSSVAKYWVFTNLFPGPIPQVSVYGIPSGARLENGKPIQELGQAHPSILNGDPNLILGHHQSQMSVSASTTHQISQISATSSGPTHAGLVSHSQQPQLPSQQSSASGNQSTGTNQSSHPQSHQQHIMQQQIMSSTRTDHSNQQIQLTVSEDGVVTVVEPAGSKLVDKEQLQEAIKMPADHQLTVHQLQQIVGQQVFLSIQLKNVHWN